MTIIQLFTAKKRNKSINSPLPDVWINTEKGIDIIEEVHTKQQHISAALTLLVLLILLVYCHDNEATVLVSSGGIQHFGLVPLLMYAKTTSPLSSMSASRSPPKWLLIEQTGGRNSRMELLIYESVYVLWGFRLPCEICSSICFCDQQNRCT